MRLHSSTLLFILFVAVILSTASYTRSNSQVTEKQEAEKVPALALKAGVAVYSNFVDYLNKEPLDNDFTRFASNPANFTVSIADKSDRLVYTFVLNAYRKGPVLDRPISFSWSKADGKIQRTMRP